MADGLIDRLRWNPDTPFMDEDVGAIHNAGLDDLRDLLRSPETRGLLLETVYAAMDPPFSTVEVDRVTDAVVRVLTGEAGDE